MAKLLIMRAVRLKIDKGRLHVFGCRVDCNLAHLYSLIHVHSCTTAAVSILSVFTGEGFAFQLSARSQAARMSCLWK